MSQAPGRVHGLVAGLLLAVGSAGCGSPESVSLETLVIRDSLYVSPGTGAPFTGPVHRLFPGEEGRVELVGRLEEGVWNGELTVHHSEGGIRYQGRLVDGTPCGAWVANRGGGEEGTLYEELVREIESLAVYPACPD